MKSQSVEAFDNSVSQPLQALVAVSVAIYSLYSRILTENHGYVAISHILTNPVPVRMVDVGEKAETARSARAESWVKMQPATLRLILDKELAKGDVLEVARLAGIMAAKKTSDLIPLCHPLALSSVEVDLNPHGDHLLHIVATVKLTGKTGVEMEALTAVSVSALTVYDMCKAVDRGMELGPARLLEKSGGKSGDFQQPSVPPVEEQ